MVAIGRGLARRLTKYLRCVVNLEEEGLDAVSSKSLSSYTGINSAQIRRDLAAVGIGGTRGVGYDLPGVSSAIRKALDLDRVHEVVLVGAGSLGEAIVHSELLSKRGFRITYIFDVDPQKLGREINGVQVRHPNEMKWANNGEQPLIGIIAVPGENAQEAADRMVEAGVRVLINYTDTLLHVPDGVEVQTVDPSSQLMHTLYYLTHVEQGVSAAL